MEACHEAHGRAAGAPLGRRGLMAAPLGHRGGSWRLPFSLIPPNEGDR